MTTIMNICIIFNMERDNRINPSHFIRCNMLKLNMAASQLNPGGDSAVESQQLKNQWKSRYPKLDMEYFKKIRNTMKIATSQPSRICTGEWHVFAE